MPKRNPVVSPLKLGDDVLVFFDKDHGTPGKLRSISGDVATVFFGKHWQYVAAETIRPFNLLTGEKDA